MALKRVAPSSAEGERPVKLLARHPERTQLWPEAKKQALPLFPGQSIHEAQARPSTSPSSLQKALLQRRLDLTDPTDDEFGELDEAKLGHLDRPQPGDAGGELFNGMGREAFMMQHVHRKLHPQIATLTDREIHDLGRLTFNEQFNLLEQNGIATRNSGPPPLHRRPMDLFGGAGREAFMQQHVHRKLHAKAVALSDQDLLALGKLSFNDQFPALEDNGINGHAIAPDYFNGLSREAYMAQRVHRRLHGQAMMLSDQQLRELGQLSFNQQFTFLESGQISHAPQPIAVDFFQGLSRDAFMQQRVHRKLHARAAPLSDEELCELGKLTFNEQFHALDQMAQFEQQATAEQQQEQQQEQPLVDFAGLSREAYMATRVHRRLHVQAAQLSDPQLLELGQMSFNMQFNFLEGTAEVVKSEPHLTDIFQGMGREGWMQQRIHRRLHARAASLSDEELLELGRRSFNDQFNTLEGQGLEAGEVFEQQMPDPFGGVGREAYMAQRVHRRLHPQAARLSDQELLELGKLSFNQQFPALEGSMGGQASAVPVAMPQDGFQGQGREGYMHQRVHRRLHSKAMLLSDSELLELGRLSFNEQFPALEHIPA